MKMKIAKIIYFLSLFIFFGLGELTEALNFTNSISINKEKTELFAKEGGSGKKSSGKKSSGKKAYGKKSSGKKSFGKKSSVKKSGDKEKQSILDKIEKNKEAIREAAKERYKKWKENKEAPKSN